MHLTKFLQNFKNMASEMNIGGSQFVLLFSQIIIIRADYELKTSDAKASKCHLIIFIKLVYLSSVISLKWQ